jgi:hypothetical protein
MDKQDEQFMPPCLNCGHAHTMMVSTGEYLDCPAIIAKRVPDRIVYTSCPCKNYVSPLTEDKP